MNLKDIISISGKPGLFKFISQAKNGIIVESLIDGKRLPAYGTDKVSALEDIAIYTDTGEVKLSEVFDKIHEKENGGKAIDPKAGGSELKSYFGEVLPDYDHERVYTSDIKKIVSWYNLLHEKDMLIPSEPEEDQETNEDNTGDDGEKESDKQA